ncbi:MAG: exodeoxyribonuclease V subunit gamma, partial [Desulfobacteraceae bacterium]
MTEISYFIGKTISSRQHLLMKKMGTSKDASFLHIVPTKGRVMELETDSGFWLNRRVNTLTGMIHRIFNEDIKPEKYPDYSPIDEILRQMLVKKALLDRSVIPQGLAYFNSLFSDNSLDRDYPGIFRNISGFFSHLYRNNYEDIYANDLGGRIIWQEEKEPGSADEKFALESDLLWLLGDYEELKREIRGYDDDDIFRNVRDFLKEKNLPSYIESFNVIILDSLTHISRIEEEILFHLINSVDELWWLIDYESTGDDPVADFRKSCGKEDNRKKGPAEGGVEACRIYYSLVSLMDRLHESGVPYRIEEAEKVSYPNPCAGAIYTDKNIDFNTGVSTLKIRSFPGEVDEVRSIASEIKRIIHEQEADGKMSPGNIRVIFPDLNDYASIVSEIFTEYGLPFSLTKGIPLSSHPFSHIFLKVLQLPLEEFRREDLFNLFSLRIINQDFLKFELPDFSLDIFHDDHYLHGDAPEDLKNLFSSEISGNISKKPDIHLFDTAMRRCGIDRLGTGLQNIDNDKITVFRDIYFDAIMETKNPDEKKSLRLEYYCFLYQRIIFKSILTPFTALLHCRTPEKIVETFNEIIRLMGFPLNIIESNNSDTGFKPAVKRGLLKRDIRAFTLLNELLNISHREIDLAQQLFKIEKSDILLDSFYSALNNRINNKYLLDERNPDVIRVSQWLETRGRSFDYVFAGGLTATGFPLKEEPDFIIPESSRGIFRIIDPVDQSKQLFSSLLKNYEKGLYLSYPENISEKPVQPSQVIQDLYALIGSAGPESHADETLSWNPNHFYTADNELLNADRNKKETTDNISGSWFNLKDIIIKDHSSEEDIIRGIKAVASRSAGNGLFEYDGLIENATEFPRFSKEKVRTFSSSSLETLANCPVKYLFQYIYKMKDLDDITPEATQKDIGQFVHDILNLFFKKLADLKTNIYNLGIDRAFRIAAQIVEKYFEKRSVLDRLDFAEFYKLELFSTLTRQSVTDEREGIIASLLRYENEHFMNRIPEGIEFEFGNHDKLVKLGNVFIKGYIDRFD